MLVTSARKHGPRSKPAVYPNTLFFPNCVAGLLLTYSPIVPRGAVADSHLLYTFLSLNKVFVYHKTVLFSLAVSLTFSIHSVLYFPFGS